MDENLTTAGEPTIVESTVTPTDTGTVTTNTDIADGSQVIETPTQMDNNVTYNNIDITNDVTDPTITNPTEPTNDIIIDPNKSLVDNVYDNIVTHEHDTNLTENSGSAMKNFFLKDYDYDVDEVGSYWVGGAMNDVKNQMSFLNVLINEEMYDALDLQKYYFDNNLATARAYAAKKDKETAYNYYRAAQEKAIAEGELTGWYMPAEGRYMLGQYTIAMNILENPDASQEERDKADRIKGTVEDWFGANKIGTQGIKTLGMMNYEETVRHNKVTERLQKQANAASGSAAAASLKATLWDIAELELVWRTDLDENGTIGYTNEQRREAHSDLFQYLNEHEAWQGWYKWSETRDAAWNGGSYKTMAHQAGVDYDKIDQEYNAAVKTAAVENDLTKFGYIREENMTKSNLTLDDNTYYTTFNNDKEGRTELVSSKNTDKSLFKIETPNGNVYYTKTGDTYEQITRADTELSNGKTIGEIDKYFTGETYKDSSGNKMQVGPYVNKSTYNTKYSDKTFISKGGSGYLNETQSKALKKYTDEGWTIADGYMETKGSNTALVLCRESADEDGNPKTEYALIDNNGNLNKDFGEKDVIDIHIDSETGKPDWNNAKYPLSNDFDKNIGTFYSNWDGKELAARDTGYKIGTYVEGKKTYNAYVRWNSDGTPVYTIKDRNGIQTFLPMSKAEAKTGIKLDSIYSNWQDVKDEHSALKKGKDWSKNSTAAKVVGDANKDVATTDVEKENKKGVKVSGGGASAPKIIDSQQAKGSDEVTFITHNTELSPDEIATQNVLAYDEDKEKERQKQNKERSINNIKEVS